MPPARRTPRDSRGAAGRPGPPAGDGPRRRGDRSWPDLVWYTVCGRAKQPFALTIRQCDAALGPIQAAMQRPDPSQPIPDAVNHDVVARIDALSLRLHSL